MYLMLFAALPHAASAGTGEREITLADLRDKIEGGWTGQMIRVAYGAPTEFRFLEKIILPKLSRNGHRIG